MQHIIFATCNKNSSVTHVKFYSIYLYLIFTFYNFDLAAFLYLQTYHHLITNIFFNYLDLIIYFKQFFTYLSDFPLVVKSFILVYWVILQRKYLHDVTSIGWCKTGISIANRKWCLYQIKQQIHFMYLFIFSASYGEGWWAAFRRQPSSQFLPSHPHAAQRRLTRQHHQSNSSAMLISQCHLVLSCGISIISGLSITIKLPSKAIFF